MNDMEGTIILYLLKLRLQGASQVTLVTARSQLGRLNRFFRRPVQKLTEDDYARYVAWLRGHLSENSIVGHLGTTHQFLNWCVDEGFLEKNPFPTSKENAPRETGEKYFVVQAPGPVVRQPR